MRRTVGLALVVIGALLLVLSPLLRWYAYPRLAVVSDTVAEGETLVVPDWCTADGQEETLEAGDPNVACTMSAGEDVTVLDITAVAQGKDDVTRTVDIMSVRRVVPDVGVGTDDTAVWETGVNTMDAGATDPDKSTLSAYTARVAFDRNLGSAVPGFSQYYWPSDDPDDKVERDHTGQYFKMPFDTQQQDYDWWDPTIGETRPMVFDAEDDLEGLAVYRFVQEIEPTVVAELDVPGSLFDVDEPTVEADRVYKNTRTVWIEPTTGVVIKGQEDQDAYLEYNGRRGPTVTAGTIAYTDEQVEANVEKYESSARLLGLVHTSVPIWAAVLGVVLIAAGVSMAARAGRYRRRDRSPSDDITPMEAAR